MTDESLDFAEFATPSDEDWKAAAAKSLKGGALERLSSPTYEGLTVQPIYSRQDSTGIGYQESLPGFPPYMRGNQAAGYLQRSWIIAQEISFADPATFNAALRDDFAQGVEAVVLPLESAGHHSVSMSSMAAALDGIDLTQLQVVLRGGSSGLAAFAILGAYLRESGISEDALRGWIVNDPLGELVKNGALPDLLKSLYDEIVALTVWASEHAPELATIAVETLPYHNAGANAVQELAYALATGVAYIRALQERGLTIDEIAPRMRFGFGLGGDFFMEIAKLRAARMLWAQVIAAFGGSSDSQRMTIHAQSGLRNKSVADAHNNLLRTTLEALAAVIAGSDGVQTLAYDAVYQSPDEFSRRIARNQQLILRHECKLDALIDPAGGSYFVEGLTDQLARSAWTLFQGIEIQGGMLTALEDRRVQDQVAEIAQQRADNLNRRKDGLVGINMYANPLEVLPRSQDGSAQVQQTQAVNSSQALSQYSGAALVEAAIEAARQGSTVGQINQAMRDNVDPGLRIQPLTTQRLSGNFEQLRYAAQGYAVPNGRPPQIFLAQLGSYLARAGFTMGFFEPGGFDMLDQGVFETPEQAAQAALDSGAPVVVICSSDSAYPEIVPPLVQRIKAAKPEIYVILAGYPEDQVEAHRAAGIDDFIHMRSNCYEINLKVQRQIGVQA